MCVALHLYSSSIQGLCCYVGGVGADEVDWDVKNRFVTKLSLY